MYTVNKTINGLDVETTIADTDELVFGDVSDSNRAKKITFANLKTDFVRKSLYDANTILYATTDDTPVALTVGTNSVVGRVAGSISTLAIDSDLTSVSTSDDTVPSAKATKTALDLKATDSAVVKLTGDQTVAGVKTFTSDPIIPDEVYSSSWNGVLEPPTKNAVYDKIESIPTVDTNLILGVGSATTVKTYNNFEYKWSESLWSTTAFTLTAYGAFLKGSATGASNNGVITTNGIGIKVTTGGGGGAAELAFGDGKDVIVEFSHQRVTAGTVAMGWGLSTTTAPFYTYTDTGADAACFVVDSSGNLYGHTSNGSAMTNSSAITGVTLTNNNTYRIEVNDGVDVKFYVNGVLKATNTTNLPNSGTIKFGLGTANNTNDNDRLGAGPVIFAIEK